MNAKPHVIIAGAGISGLAAAHRLTELSRQHKLPLEITVLDAGPRPGGVIDTASRGGFLFEGGPDCFLSEKPWAFELCRRLGLENEIINTRAADRRSFIVHRGRLCEVPEGFYLLAPARLSALARLPFLSARGKLRMAAEMFIPEPDNAGDESVGSFVRRRFGAEAVERIAQPMIGGIYTADPDQLSLLATFPRFRELARRYGSVIRGLQKQFQKPAAEGVGKGVAGPRYSLFLSLRGGLRTLVDRLAAAMPEVRFRSSARVEKVRPAEAWHVTLAGGEEIRADALCLALPGHASAALLGAAAPDLAAELKRVPYESAATVNFAFRREDVGHPLNGFGFVAPAAENLNLVGCTFSHMKFEGRAPAGAVLLRAFAGGAAQRGLLASGEEELVRVVKADLTPLLGLRGEPLFVSARRHELAMPQYPVGHLKTVEKISDLEKLYPGLYLTGNYLRGVGVPDCVREAEQAAERIRAFLSNPGAKEKKCDLITS